MQIALSIITVTFQTWARLLLCFVFIVAGGNFSHGSALHHQPERASASHHLAIDQNLTDHSLQPHSHIEPEAPNNKPDSLAVHCGSPELQPNAEIFSHQMVVIGTVENSMRIILSGKASNLEPPPPRK